MTATGVPYYWVWPSWLPFCPFFQLLVFCPEWIPSHTHSLSHMHSCRSAPVPMPKHLPHGHIQSPCSSPPLLALFISLTFSFTTSLLVKVAYAHSHGHSHKQTNTDYCPERKRDGKGRFCGMLERTERGWGQRELENREGKRGWSESTRYREEKFWKGQWVGCWSGGRYPKREEKKTGKIAGRVENLNWHEKVLAQFSILLLYEDWRSFLRIWLTLKDRTCLCKLKNSHRYSRICECAHQVHMEAIAQRHTESLIRDSKTMISAAITSMQIQK